MPARYPDIRELVEIARRGVLLIHFCGYLVGCDIIATVVKLPSGDVEVEVEHGNEALRQKIRDIYLGARKYAREELRDVHGYVGGVLLDADTYFHASLREDSVCPEGCFMVFFIKFKKLK